MSDIGPAPVAPMPPPGPPQQEDFLTKNRWYILGGVVILGAGGLLLFEHKKNTNTSSSTGSSSAAPQYYELAPGTLQQGGTQNTSGGNMSGQWNAQQQVLQQDITSLQQALTAYQGVIPTSSTSPSNSSGTVNGNASTAA
jgi:hypothetical protein